MAEIELTPAALQQASDLPRAIKLRVDRLITRLRKWPAVSGAKPLTGNLVGRYRLRTGAYRLQFHVEGERVIIEKIGHRDKFYED